MNNKIDWFTIDMDAFQKMYDEYVAAHERYTAASDAFDKCEAGECLHNRKKKKDGTPDKRYECPMLRTLWDAQVKAGNHYHYSHHEFFEAVGLGVNANV